MDQEFFTWLVGAHGLGVHITIFGMLILGGFGFPIPEDIPLILGGVAAAQNIVSFKAILFTCYVGVVLADQLIYFFGYFFGQKLLTAGTKSELFPSITEERVERIRGGLRRRRFVCILIGRHFFPLRTATFLVAGSLAIPYLEFLLADAIAALVSVAIVTSLGFWLGGQLTPEVISHLIHKSNYYLLGLAVFCGAVYVFSLNIKRKKRRSSVPPRSLSSISPIENWAAS